MVDETLKVDRIETDIIDIEEYEEVLPQRLSYSSAPPCIIGKDIERTSDELGDKLQQTQHGNEPKTKLRDEWIEEFQRIYLMKGMRDFEAQAPYLEELAQYYESLFDETGCWEHAYKAYALYISASGVEYDGSPASPWNVKAWGVVSKYMGPQYKAEVFYTAIDKLHDSSIDLRMKLKADASVVETKLNASQAAYNDTNFLREVIHIVTTSNDHMIHFANEVIRMSIDFLACQLPCAFTAVGIGSLARGEATPYSDIEYIFLIEDSIHKPFFEKLAVLTYMLIMAFKETKLGSVAIEELEGQGREKGWFVDKRSYGYQIDGITKTSGNVPTRNDDKPGGFIVTPQELADEYHAVLGNPNSKEALKGDLTAMLMFTTVLFSSEPGETETLLSAFIKRRREMNESHNEARRKINLQMLHKDLRKFTFHPEYDLYFQGFSLNVKKQFYRYPSLLLLDLTTILEPHYLGKDSWTTVELLKDEFKSSLMDSLHMLLALSCFARLRCYLLQDAHSDAFASASRKQSSLPSGIASANTGILFQDESLPIWEMATKEFMHFTQNLLMLQDHFPKESGKLTTEMLRELLNKDIETEPRINITALSHYFCCEWTTVNKKLNRVDLDGLPVEIKIALAFSLMKSGNFQQAGEHFEDLTEQRLTEKERINIQRNLGMCYEECCSLNKGDNAFLKAFKLCETVALDYDLLRQRSYILLSRGLSMSKQHKYDEACHVLFDALKIFILNAGTGESCTEINTLEHFLSSQTTEDDRLEFIGNSSRELAHCLYSIAKVFHELSKPALAKRYHAKAHKLGLKFIRERMLDNVTTITLLQEVGESLEDSKYFEGALYILEKSTEKDSQYQLTTDVLLSILECASHAKDPISQSKQLELELEMELSSVIAKFGENDGEGGESASTGEIHEQLFGSTNRTDNWYRQATKVLQNVDPKDYDPEMVKLFEEVVEHTDLAGDSQSDIKENLQEILKSLRVEGVDVASRAITKLASCNDIETQTDAKEVQDMMSGPDDQMAYLKMITKTQCACQTDSPMLRGVNTQTQRLESNQHTQTHSTETKDREVGILEPILVDGVTQYDASLSTAKLTQTPVTTMSLISGPRPRPRQAEAGAAAQSSQLSQRTIERTGDEKCVICSRIGDKRFMVMLPCEQHYVCADRCYNTLEGQQREDGEDMILCPVREPPSDPNNRENFGNATLLLVSGDCDDIHSPSPYNMDDLYDIFTEKEKDLGAMECHVTILKKEIKLMRNELGDEVVSEEETS